jgi:hypothetical protein
MYDPDANRERLLPVLSVRMYSLPTRLHVPPPVKVPVDGLLTDIQQVPSVYRMKFAESSPGATGSFGPSSVMLEANSVQLPA